MMRKALFPNALAALTVILLGVATIVALPSAAFALEGNPAEVLRHDLGNALSTINTESRSSDTTRQSSRNESNEEPASASSEGAVLEVRAGGREILVIGRTSSSANRDGSTSGDATVLAVAGHEIIGAHSESRGGKSTTSTGYLTETCAATNGSVCLALLYGSSSASDSNSSSSGYSYSALLSACVGGNQERPDQACDGPVSARLGESRSSASAHKQNGTSRADHSSSAADVCIGGEDADTGTCNGAGAALLESASSSEGGPGSKSKASSDSSIATLEAQGEDQFAISDEEGVSVPPGCPKDAALCVTLNSRTTTSSSGKGGASGEALRVEVLKGVVGEEGVLSASASKSGSEVSGSGAAGSGAAGSGEVGRDTDDEVMVAGLRRPRTDAQGVSALAATGPDVYRFVLAALVLLSLGCGGLTAASRSSATRP